MIRKLNYQSSYNLSTRPYYSARILVDPLVLLSLLTHGSRCIPSPILSHKLIIMCCFYNSLSDFMKMQFLIIVLITSKTVCLFRLCARCWFTIGLHCFFGPFKMQKPLKRPSEKALWKGLSKRPLEKAFWTGLLNRPFEREDNNKTLTLYYTT